MWPKLKERIWQWRGVLIIAPSMAGLAIAGAYAGLFEILDWGVLDRFFCQRPLEPPDPRILVVTIDESDITRIGQWPIPDSILAQAIESLKMQQPRAIGLDLYRDLPVAPGYAKLIEVFESTPNLIGVEKVVGRSVAPPPILNSLDRVAIADLVLDSDGKVRRGLMSVKRPNGQIQLSLGVRLSLKYLESEKIAISKIDKSTKHVGWGKATFIPFHRNDGGYIRADAGGYQILLNYRGTQANFHTVSMTQVLNGQISPNLVRDRIVLIGSTAPSLNDLFYTPYSRDSSGSPQLTPGVFIHANLTSQILNAVLHGRPLIRVWPDPIEWLWILGWSFTGATMTWIVVQTHRLRNHLPILRTVAIALLAASILITSSYLLFLSGWWIPAIAPLVALTGSTIAIALYQIQRLQRLAYLDALTQVANRRYFDDYLDLQWWQKAPGKMPLSLILCDVDYFKVYNDTYGHQAGDECLQQIAKTICSVLRRTDLVARYGGEEFAVILPNTNEEMALEMAEKICFNVKALQIVHANSKVSPHVTLSCGVASTGAESISCPAHLIAIADKALYVAKAQGRDRAISHAT